MNFSEMLFLLTVNKELDLQLISLSPRLSWINSSSNVGIQLDLAFNNVKPKDRYFVLD